jgi:hypothetical protein
MVSGKSRDVHVKCQTELDSWKYICQATSIWTGKEGGHVPGLTPPSTIALFLQALYQFAPDSFPQYISYRDKKKITYKSDLYRLSQHM